MVRTFDEPLIGERVAWVKRSAFLDEDIYQREQERVFRRAWLFLGHESQIRKPRDFFTAYMGEESVIVTRDSAGQMHAFLNTCRHRGMRVCRADKGSTAAFTCSYHAWTYDTTGALIGVPKFKEGYYGELDKSEWGLLPVARVDSYKGLIFGTFEPEASSLREYLGDMAWYLDVLLDRRAGGTELIGGVHRWIMKANWKVAADNNSGDWYHVPYTHGSIQRVFPRRGPGNPLQDMENRMQVSAHPGHTLVALLQDTPEAAVRGVSSIVQEYYLSVLPEAIERLGPVRSRMVFIAGNVFPNFGWVPGSHTIRVYQPRGPEQMEVWSFCLVDTEAPREVKDAIRADYVRRFGPSGMLEQDDGENWSQVSASSRSSLARTLEFNYQMGLGHERYHEDLPGQVGNATGELTQRSFYGRWSAEMGLSAAGDGENGAGGGGPA
jgi:phenylpropionate dioxygenase-like ring-hydroxylating dioxygenase large terminal subunit